MKKKNAEYGGQPEILALVLVIERLITFHCEESNEGTVFGEVFTRRPSTDILCCPEKRGVKEELKKLGIISVT